MDRRADRVEKTDRQREDRQTDRQTDRQEAERAILTVIEVFIWIEQRATRDTRETWDPAN